MQLGHSVTVAEAVQILAMVGDLSMGQTTGQSIRSANLAELLARADGADAEVCAHARLVTLLRWSGCTANASGFSTLLGDDVGGRDAMLSQTLPPTASMSFTSVAPLARIHCEVSGAIAQAMSLPAEVEIGLLRVWEHYDGGGMPERLCDPDIPRLVYYASLAGDFEILTRVHGLEEGLRLITARSDKKYPESLVHLMQAHADTWIDACEDSHCPVGIPALALQVPLTIIADMIELKLPWLLGYSRRVADLAERAAVLANLSPSEQRCLGRAALIHGIGRAAVPNVIWQRSGKLDASDWEKLRLVPYWTARAAIHVPALKAEAVLASHVYERLDGSGYFRGLGDDTLNLPQRILAVAAAYTALCMPRPWRALLTASDAAHTLETEAANGRFDIQAVNFVVAAADGTSVKTVVPSQRQKLLSERETAVLRRLSLGESNKEAARELQISPSTVRTHVESIFRKLGCTTRTAATLKGLTLGLI